MDFLATWIAQPAGVLLGSRSELSEELGQRTEVDLIRKIPQPVSRLVSRRFGQENFVIGVELLGELVLGHGIFRMTAREFGFIVPGPAVLEPYFERAPLRALVDVDRKLAKCGEL